MKGYLQTQFEFNTETFGILEKKKVTFLVIFMFTVRVQYTVLVLESEINVHSNVHYTILFRSIVCEK